MKKKLTISKLQKKLWEECKRLTRQKYGNTCFTCGKTGLEGSNYQTGHFIPSSTCGAYLRYDLRNLRPQCARCNLFGSGEGAEYYRRLVAREGQSYVDQLFADKNKIVKAFDHYSNLLAEYQGM